MDRRRFIGGIAATSLSALPGLARAQAAGKVWRIGFLSLASGPTPVIDAFREQLRLLGYVEGRNALIDYRWAAEKADRLPELARELVAGKVDVIVTVGTPATKAAKAASSATPIVMAAVGDPVLDGLVTSLARPGGNVTGLSLLNTELAGKRLQLLREVDPKVTRIAILAGKGVGSRQIWLDQFRMAAEQMGIAIAIQRVSTSQELVGAFAVMRGERAQALFVPINTFASYESKRIVELAAQQRLPTLFEIRSFVDSGGLMSYGPSLPDMYRRTTYYVDRIFKGANPADLPVEQPSKYEMIINLKTARALGIKVPQAVLVRADEVIQ